VSPFLKTVNSAPRVFIEALKKPLFNSTII
jgi:hypothetical protein